MMSSKVRPSASASWSSGMRRTTMGWSTPISRIEWTSSAMWSSSKTVRGCLGLGRIDSMSSSANSAPGTAARPLVVLPVSLTTSDLEDVSSVPGCPAVTGDVASVVESSPAPGTAGVSGCFCSVKKTSTGRPAPPLGALGISAPRPRPSARRFSAIPQPFNRSRHVRRAPSQSRCSERVPQGARAWCRGGAGPVSRPAEPHVSRGTRPTPARTPGAGLSPPVSRETRGLPSVSRETDVHGFHVKQGRRHRRRPCLVTRHPPTGEGEANCQVRPAAPRSAISPAASR